MIAAPSTVVETEEGHFYFNHSLIPKRQTPQFCPAYNGPTLFASADADHADADHADAGHRAARRVGGGGASADLHLCRQSRQEPKLELLVACCLLLVACCLESPSAESPSRRSGAAIGYGGTI